MSAAECILAKAQAGLVDERKAQQIADRMNKIDEELMAEGGTRSWHDRQVAAAQRVETDLRRELARKKRMRLRQVQASDRIKARFASFPGEPRQVALSFLDFDPRGRVHGPNVAMQAEDIRGRSFALMADFMSEFRSKAAGLYQRTAGLDDVVRELFGEKTGSGVAANMAKSIDEGFRYLVGRFNVSGGDIQLRKNFGLPQGHDRIAVAKVTKDEWIDWTWQRLDRSKMTGPDGEELTLRGMRNTLDALYEEISSGGLTTNAGADPRAVNNVAKRTHHRFLAFKNADAWLEYQKRFGDDDVFGTVIGHVDNLSRDIALQEVLGPYSERSLQLLAELQDGPSKHLTDTYNFVAGKLSRPDNGVVAEISQASRNLAVASKLGGALFSSFSDLATQTMAARMVGMPIGRVLSRQLKLLNPRNLDDKLLAARAGFIAETWTSRAVAAQRLLGEVTGPAWSSKLADTVLRLAGVNAWTDAGRQAFQLEFLGFISDQAKKALGELPGALRSTFERHGITADVWDIIRRTPEWADPETGEVRFIRPDDVAQFDNPALPAGDRNRLRWDAANRLGQMVHVESIFAITKPTARVRALLTGGLQSGTFWGEAVRDLTLFKSFSVTMTHLHVMRGSNIGMVAAARYAPALIVGTAVMGTLGDQLSEISKGKDPHDLTDWRSWAKGLSRGGSLGLMGDFLFSAENRYGGGLASTLVGPIIGEASSVAGTVDEQVRRAVAGKDTRVGRALVKFIHDNLPGQSLFYARLALEREVFDQIDRMIDPDAGERFARIEKRARDEFDQRFWFRPGKALPDRAPDLAAAGGKP